MQNKTTEIAMLRLYSTNSSKRPTASSQSLQTSQQVSECNYAKRRSFTVLFLLKYGNSDNF